MRNITFIENEYYHVYNRGVDKRIIFLDASDINRFLDCLDIFNRTDRVGSVHEFSRTKNAKKSPLDKQKLVNIIAYCVNPNHYHFILEQVTEKGIEKFMHKLSMGYAKYFNAKHKRSGSLFQGKFKAKLIDSNEYLLHLSAYINLNDNAHGLAENTNNQIISESSWNEYTGKEKTRNICTKDIVINQFLTIDEYRFFAEESLKEIIRKKKEEKEIESIDNYYF